ncbi:MAG: asparagine synthase (glutamine-hydrolyzing) [Planctomycetaceae bacterium]
MCGIAGFLNLDGEPASAELLSRMTAAVAHRGPDGSGLHVEANAALGHRRLAILDLSDAGRQPMSTDDGRFVISYNGEVYNFRELRRELESCGHSFRSQTDTEVVLRAYVEWGEACLNRLNGMFAFAIWDRRKRELFLARDRYGIKPLHYARIGATFLFASEIKGLFAHTALRPEIDPEALVEYFTFQNLISDRSLYRGVRMLPAGSSLVVSAANRDAAIVPRRYWSFRFEEPTNPASEAEYREELVRLFRQAVERQLVSDVEVGAYLSGGMDSGSINAVASRSHARWQTFTCGFDMTTASESERRFDERSAAAKISSLLGTTHHERVLNAGDLERGVAPVAWHLDEPRVGQSYPNYYAAELASEHVKVVLSGTGGDEFFGGYPWRYYPQVGSNRFGEFTDRYYQFWQRLVPEQSRREFFAPIWREVRHVDTRSLFHELLAGDGNSHNASLTPEACVNLCLDFEARTFLHGLLAVEDKLSMAHGLESRVPFLDNDLVDFAMQLPVRQKLGRLDEIAKLLRSDGAGRAANSNLLDGYIHNPRDGKTLLRDAMNRLLPEEITKAGKQGFSAPDAAWFRQESLNYVRRTLDGPDSKLAEFLDPAAVRAVLDEHAEGRRNRRLLIWSLLSVEQCLRSSCEQRTESLAAA